MISQQEKAEAFRALHEEEGCFILPNPWDTGSARLLQAQGFRALATTSAGFATSVGLRDYHVTRDMVMAHAETLCSSVSLPISADLENGFGDAPEHCAETIRRAAMAGLVGGSIEDFTGIPGQQYDLALAKDRITAAVDAANSLAFPFMLTARAENFFTGTPNLADTITRLQAYQEAGAHVLYAPGLPTLDDIRSVMASVDRPVNILLGPNAGLVPVGELAALGVKRISLGSVLAGAAYAAMLRATEELIESGTFGFMKQTLSGSALVEKMEAGMAE